MSKKIYRRLLLTAFMLLVTAGLTYTSPTRAQDPCSECHDNCDAQYEICLISGSHCEQSRDLCHQACINVCS
ncbi:MAG TPA: hypothetical protein VJP89_04830 [Pyrinomonadaceae bacterium]|nr:hypothetical protein [Pyrinomonadaceae bacterium]